MFLVHLWTTDSQEINQPQVSYIQWFIAAYLKRSLLDLREEEDDWYISVWSGAPHTVGQISKETWPLFVA